MSAYLGPVDAACGTANLIATELHHALYVCLTGSAPPCVADTTIGTVKWITTEVRKKSIPGISWNASLCQPLVAALVGDAVPRDAFTLRFDYSWHYPRESLDPVERS
jgi:hypothetical protein